MRRLIAVLGVLVGGCATVDNNERALFYSAGNGLNPSPVTSGWHWHWPWNHYVFYDVRWTSHTEQIHIHSKDGLHMDIDVAVVVRPNVKELYELDRDSGPDFYDQLVKPAVFAATRDATSKFNHLEIATDTHHVEEGIQQALVEHMAGQHIEVSEVAIQHFELPKDVEDAANRKAAAGMLLAAKDVDFKLAQSNAQIEQEKRRQEAETTGLEQRLRAQQELEQAKLAIQIQTSKAEAAKTEAESDATVSKIRAAAESDATKLKASAEKDRIQSVSQNLSPAYVHLQAIDALAKAMSAPNAKVYVVPVGKNGLPQYFAPFLGNELGQGGRASGE
jgi:regulator of protease activity HflC (stomatin/prohibitin superfamily)